MRFPMIRRAAKPPRQRRSTRLLVASFFAVVLSVGLVGFSPAAQAIDYNCANGDNNPRSNNTDVCRVFTGDRDVQYVGTFKVADYCTSSGATYNQTRVRVIGSWVSSGRKLLIKSIGIRYVSGTKPWAAYSVNIQDGNGVYYHRSWHDYGYDNPIGEHPALRQDLGNLVTTLTPTPGFAPPFGAGNVNLTLVAHFYDHNPNSGFPETEACRSDGMALRFTPV